MSNQQSQLATDAQTLETIAARLPGVEAGPLRVVAQSLKQRAAAMAAPTSASAGSGSAAPAPGSVLAELQVMAGQCEECKSKATGQAPQHALDLMKHSLENHAAKLQALLDQIAGAAMAAPAQPSSAASSS